MLTIKHHSSEKWCARRESHPGLRTGGPPRCCYATRALVNSAPAGLGPPAGFIWIREGKADSGLGSRTGASLRKMAALTGFAPVSLGLKDRDPELLDDKAEWSADQPGVRNKFPVAALLIHSQKFKRGAGIAV